MRSTMVFLMVLWMGTVSVQAGEGIVAVLARSQNDRLEHMMPVDPSGERAMKVRASFETVVRRLGIRHLLELRVISGATVAETLQGRVVVANESLADLDEGERIFVLAHELGHVELRHWAQTEGLYRKWVPGEVSPEETDPVAGALGRDASRLAHEQELQADAFALNALHRLGLPMQDAVNAFVHLGLNQDTATHPGTRKRLASLRAADAQWQAVAVQTTTRKELIDSVKRPD